MAQMTLGARVVRQLKHLYNCVVLTASLQWAMCSSQKFQGNDPQHLN